MATTMAHGTTLCTSCRETLVRARHARATDRNHHSVELGPREGGAKHALVDGIYSYPGQAPQVDGLSDGP